MRIVNRIKYFALLLSALGLFNLPAWAADQNLINSAKAEGSVTWYTGFLVNEFVEPVAKAFEAKYGIRVEYARSSSSDIIMRVGNEARAGKIQADVIDGSNFVPLYKGGLALPYIPSNAREYPEGSVAKDGIWVSTNSNYLTLAYNTSLVSDAEVPNTFEALLDPKWSGKISITDSLNPTGGPGFVGAALTRMGEENGTQYLKKLATQKIVIIPANQKVVLDGVMAGEFPIALMTFNHHSVIGQKQGAPIEWARFDPVVASRTYVSIIKGGPHPNAGKLLVEFLMSQEGQALFAAADYIPNLPSVPPRDPRLRPDGGNFKTFDITIEQLDKDFGQWRTVFKELFQK